MHPVTVEEVMTRDVITARPETPFKEIAALMLEHDISGVPIVGEDGRLTGIVTEADLLASEAEDKPQRRKRSFVEWILHPGRARVVEGMAEDLRGRDMMTASLVTVAPDATLDEAIRVLLDQGVKRMPVTDEDRHLLGIVSRGDLLRPFMRADEEILREIVDEVLVGAMWLDPEDVSVEVSRGIVRLGGEVDRRSTKEILGEMVHRVPGVVGVEDADLTFERDDRKVGTGPSRAPLGGHLRGR